MQNLRRKNESGRSMVEMLGVLAIIGVLSAGGVYGYGVAMKKHKANELLHQASMLAATVSAQIESLGGDLPETITDFGSTNYGKFSTSVTQTEDKKKFVLTIENVDSSVCDQLKKGGIIQGIECKAGSSEGKKNAQITYYKNLATNPAEGEKSPTGGESSSKVTCNENEKVYVTYTGGHCCDRTITEKLCPEEETPTCVKDPGCDCFNKSCCDSIGGSWGMDVMEEKSICCTTGTARCPVDGSCICIPPDTPPELVQCTNSVCIACNAGEAPLCKENEYGQGFCICVPDGYNTHCDGIYCIACPPDKEAKCIGSECACIPEGYSWSASGGREQWCTTDEGTAYCDRFGYANCLCIPKGYTGDCSMLDCITCSPTEGQAVCGEFDCTCKK